MDEANTGEGWSCFRAIRGNCNRKFCQYCSLPINNEASRQDYIPPKTLNLRDYLKVLDRGVCSADVAYIIQNATSFTASILDLLLLCRDIRTHWFVTFAAFVWFVWFAVAGNRTNQSDPQIECHLVLCLLRIQRITVTESEYGPT